MNLRAALTSNPTSMQLLWFFGSVQNFEFFTTDEAKVEFIRLLFLKLLSVVAKLIDNDTRYD